MSFSYQVDSENDWELVYEGEHFAEKSQLYNAPVYTPIPKLNVDINSTSNALAIFVRANQYNENANTFLGSVYQTIETIFDFPNSELITERYNLYNNNTIFVEFSKFEGFYNLVFNFKPYIEQVSIKVYRHIGTVYSLGIDETIELRLEAIETDLVELESYLQLELGRISTNVQLIANYLEVEINNPPDSQLYAVRINIGGQDYIDTDGNLWLGRELPEYAGTYRTHDPIDDPNSVLYESSLNSNNAGYSDLAAPNGEYSISFYAQEWYRNDNTTRFIDIYINNVLVEQGINIWTQAGGQFKPLVKTYNVTVTDGIVIYVQAQEQKNIIACALAIIQLSAA